MMCNSNVNYDLLLCIQQDNSNAPLGTGGVEQKKKTYWPGEESDDQAGTGKAKNNKPVPAGKAKVTVIK